VKDSLTEDIEVFFNWRFAAWKLGLISVFVPDVEADATLSCSDEFISHSMRIFSRDYKDFIAAENRVMVMRHFNWFHKALFTLLQTEMKQKER
jgi:hypothetical protein